VHCFLPHADAYPLFSALFSGSAVKLNSPA
jgi:hypothetical protein